ncbi:MAG: hypothetical protein AABW59_02985 [archaeon]
MPILRRRVNRAVVRMAKASEKFQKDFYATNPNWKGNEAEAVENEWASQAPDSISGVIAARNNYKKAMNARAKIGPLRMAANPKAAMRLLRMRAAKKNKK